MAVLIVEDLKVMRRVIANILKDLGINEIAEAEDGIDALSLLQDNNDFELIITDWLMPNMDGLELVEDIKSDEQLKNIPILMITSVDDKINVIKALRAGIRDYITKPFKPDLLQVKISKILKGK